MINRNLKYSEFIIYLSIMDGNIMSELQVLKKLEEFFKNDEFRQKEYTTKEILTKVLSRYDIE